MSGWHLFAMVWGDAFVERFARIVAPFLAMPGNVPALARTAPVTCHVYTDELSQGSVKAALAPLATYCAIDIRRFDVTVAHGLSGPDYKYEIQRRSVQDLAERVSGETIVLLDSNFVLADGVLGFLAARRSEGYVGASVSFLRVSSTEFVAALDGRLDAGSVIGPRELFDISRQTIHHIAKSFFVDAAPFTPYPSQVSWPVGARGFVNRNFLPHPIMIPATPKVAHYQSTMDYDLLLRVADDDKIYVCGDSDEVMVAKYSDDEHHVARAGEFRPTAEDLGLFLLTCTNRRHRLFADRACVFHPDPHDERYEAVVKQSQIMIDGAYEWINRLATRSGRLDARMLMYLKSHFGPIEDYMSPQLEPAAWRHFT